VIRLVLAVIPVVAFAQLCEPVEGIGMGSGSITVHNNDNDTHEVVISDDPSCTVGYRSELHGDTTRMYDVAETGSYMCIAGRGGMKVENGGSYVVRGGALGAK